MKKEGNTTLRFREIPRSYLDPGDSIWALTESVYPEDFKQTSHMSSPSTRQATKSLKIVRTKRKFQIGLYVVSYLLLYQS